MEESDLKRKRRKRQRERDEEKVETEVEKAIASLVNLETLLGKKPRKKRRKDVERDKSWWENGYRTWDDNVFKKVLRINKDTFEYILNDIRIDITKQPTNMKPHPIPPETQLALTLYRLAHGCSFLTLEHLFGWSIATCEKVSNVCCSVLVRRLYDQYVRLPGTDDEWNRASLKGFIENYEFPCVGAWDRFHIYVSTNITNFFSFKYFFIRTPTCKIGKYNLSHCFLQKSVLS